MTPSCRNSINDPDYLIMIVGLIGTTITPWMQFYLQASIVEKGVIKRDYSLSRIDVIFGCIVTDVIAFFIVVACAATIYHTQHPEIEDVAEAAKALVPFAGKFAMLLFAVGLINASLMSAAILPLATPTTSAKEWASNRGSTSNSAKRRFSIRSLRRSSVRQRLRADPGPAAAESDPDLSGRERRVAAVCADVHADPGKSS